MVKIGLISLIYKALHYTDYFDNPKMNNYGPAENNLR